MKVRKEVKEAMKVLGIDRCRRGQLKPIGKILKVKDMLLKEAIEDRRAEDARAARTFGTSGGAPQEV